MTKKNLFEHALPQTRTSIAADLVQLGIAPRQRLIVHVALSGVGWVCGGAVAFIQALLDTVTAQGTIVMPAHSPDVSHPSTWANPPVPQSWWRCIEESMPVFDARVTPTYGLGRTAEMYRTWPGVVRSDHPHWSFSACGTDAATVVADQPLAFAMGEGSPLARLYELNADVLLVGVGYEANTAFHLAEYRAGDGEIVTVSAPMEGDGQRGWQHFAELNFRTDLFPPIGAEFDETPHCRRGKCGAADVRLFSVRHAVDFATDWIRRKGQR